MQPGHPHQRPSYAASIYDRLSVHSFHSHSDLGIASCQHGFLSFIAASIRQHIRLDSGFRPGDLAGTGTATGTTRSGGTGRLAGCVGTRSSNGCLGCGSDVLSWGAIALLWCQWESSPSQQPPCMHVHLRYTSMKADRKTLEAGRQADRHSSGDAPGKL